MQGRGRGVEGAGRLGVAGRAFLSFDQVERYQAGWVLRGVERC